MSSIVIYTFFHFICSFILFIGSSKTSLTAFAPAVTTSRRRPLPPPIPAPINPSIISALSIAPAVPPANTSV
jgi:hypothetical protein